MEVVGPTGGGSHTTAVSYGTTTGHPETETCGTEDACCEPRGLPGCEDPAIMACVCAGDPFCCDQAWDGICVASVNALGCGFCPDVGESFGSTSFGSFTDSLGETETGSETDTGGGPGGPIPPEDPRFGLLENHGAALEQITLEAALDALAEGSALTGRALYENLIDNYASAEAGRLSDISGHCTGDLNGFPLTCDRLEAQQFDNLDRWFATAVVNRIDLAPEDGSNCGQQRIVFANGEFIGNGRMFLIMEAVIPNPDPSCGVSACRPLVEFWSSVSAEDAAVRGELLRAAFLGEGLVPGFGRFFRPEAFALPTGSIRTNNFNDDPWTLREYKLVEGPGARTPEFVTVPVTDSPPGERWTDAFADDACQQAFLDAIPHLLTNDPSRMSFPIPSACSNAESRNDFSESYPDFLGSSLRGALDARLDELGSSLTASQLAARAQFAGSCIGCHEEAVFQDLGGGVFAPPSLGFVHVGEFPDFCPEGGFCFQLSSAMTETFLPSRRQAAQTLLEMGACEGPMGDPVFSDAGLVPPPVPLSQQATLGGQSALVTH